MDPTPRVPWRWGGGGEVSGLRLHVFTRDGRRRCGAVYDVCRTRADSGQGVTWGKALSHWAVNDRPAPLMERRTALGHMMPVEAGPRVLASAWPADRYDRSARGWCETRLSARLASGRPFWAQLCGCEGAAPPLRRGSSQTGRAAGASRAEGPFCLQLGARAPPAVSLSRWSITQATDRATRHGRWRLVGTGRARRTASVSLHGVRRGQTVGAADHRCAGLRRHSSAL